MYIPKITLYTVLKSTRTSLLPSHWRSGPMGDFAVCTGGSVFWALFQRTICRHLTWYCFLHSFSFFIAFILVKQNIYKGSIIAKIHRSLHSNNSCNINPPLFNKIIYTTFLILSQLMRRCYRNVHILFETQKKSESANSFFGHYLSE